MRRVRWQKIYEEAVRNCGLDPEQVTHEERQGFVDALETALKEAWESNWWPELMRSQERWYRAWWTTVLEQLVPTVTATTLGIALGEGYILAVTNTSAFAVAQVIQVSGYLLSVQSVIPGGGGLTPPEGLLGVTVLAEVPGETPDGSFHDTDAIYEVPLTEGDEFYFPTEGGYLRWTAGVFEAVTDIDAYIALDQAGFDEIAEVEKVAERDPETEEDCGEIDFRLNAKGIQLTGTVPVSVWVRFRTAPPSWQGDEFAAGAYLEDATVFSTSRGDFYRCVADDATAVDADLDDAAKWARIDVPKIFEDFAPTVAWAEWLRTEGQGDKADREAGKAGSRLTRETEKLMGQQGQTDTYRVRTRRGRRR